MAEKEKKKKSENKPWIVTMKELRETADKRPLLRVCLSVDKALGGGIPMGSTVLLAGAFGTGKTTLAFQYAAYAQKHYKSKVFFFPVEGRAMGAYIKQVRGLKESDVHVIRPPQIEGTHLSSKWTAEQWWEIIGQTLIEHPASILIVDSISQLLSQAELTDGMESQSRGGKNKVEALFTRNFGDVVATQGSTLFLLTQVMAKVDGYGFQEAKVGNAIKHQADVWLTAKSKEKWDDSQGQVLGHTTKWYVEKSALGPPAVLAMMPLRYGYGIDDLQDAIDHAITLGLITQKGSWFVLPFKQPETEGGSPVYCEDPGEEGIKMQGATQIRNYLLLNTKLSATLVGQVHQKFFGS